MTITLFAELCLQYSLPLHLRCDKLGNNFPIRPNESTLSDFDQVDIDLGCWGSILCISKWNFSSVNWFQRSWYNWSTFEKRLLKFLSIKNIFQYFYSKEPNLSPFFYQHLTAGNFIKHPLFLISSLVQSNCQSPCLLKLVKYKLRRTSLSRKVPRVKSSSSLYCLIALHWLLNYREESYGAFAILFSWFIQRFTREL